MPTAQVVVMGVSGSGKSTVAVELAARLGCEMAEGDDFHPAANVAKMSAGVPLGDDDRWPWLRALAAWIGERDRADHSAVVTCSALKRAYRDVLRAASSRVVFAHLAGPQGLVAERMRQRKGHFMPPTLLDSQYVTLEPLASDERGLTLDVSLTPAELVEQVVVALGRPLAPDWKVLT